MSTTQLRFSFLEQIQTEELVQFGSSGMSLIPTHATFFDPLAKALRIQQSLSYCAKIDRDCPYLIECCQICSLAIKYESKFYQLL